ncbi:MAG TPA: hemolysin family protein, partial [Candidatus Babeliaceae bacterium]|nr:hemolysin family protein [Candidatus Babeliaceae bacterium]
SYDLLFQSLEKNQSRVLTTILIAFNLANVTVATVSTYLTERLFADLPGSIGFSLSIGLTTIVILIFGEIIPKNLAKIHGEKWLKSTLWITNFLFYSLYPLVTIFVKIAHYFIEKIGKGQGLEESEAITSEKEIQFLIDYINQKGLMEGDKSSMLKGVFELGTKPVKEIMVPATSMVSISVQTSLQDALSVFAKHQFSRLPVYDGTSDNIIGMLHLKDVFFTVSTNQNKTVKEIIRPIMFIPESIKVSQLLREFKQQHMHIAMVINEYGGIVGLVTLEDVLEEIVGDIRDEYESVTEKAIQLKKGSWLVDASMELENLGELLNIEFDTDDAVTLGGFLTEKLQHLPKKGERFYYKHYYFQIQQASAKKIFQVLIFEDKAYDSTENSINL